MRNKILEILFEDGLLEMVKDMLMWTGLLLLILAARVATTSAGIHPSLFTREGFVGVILFTAIWSLPMSILGRIAQSLSHNLSRN